MSDAQEQTPRLRPVLMPPAGTFIKRADSLQTQINIQHHYQILFDLSDCRFTLRLSAFKSECWCLVVHPVALFHHTHEQLRPLTHFPRSLPSPETSQHLTLHGQKEKKETEKCTIQLDDNLQLSFHMIVRRVDLKS